MQGSEMRARLNPLSCLKSSKTMCCVQTGRVRQSKIGSHSLVLTAFGMDSILGEKAGSAGDCSMGDR